MTRTTVLARRQTLSGTPAGAQEDTSKTCFKSGRNPEPSTQKDAIFSVGSFRKRLAALLSYRSPEFSGWHWCLASAGRSLTCPTEVGVRPSWDGGESLSPWQSTIRTTLGRTVENLVLVTRVECHKGKACQ